MGKLFPKEPDFPWMLCSFEPSVAFTTVKALFDEELRLLEAEELDLWAEACDRLAALNLLLNPEDGSEPITEFLLHIKDNSAWFRF